MRGLVTPLEAETDGDSVLMAGEKVQVSFTLKHEGSFPAQAVRVQLHNRDPVGGDPPARGAVTIRFNLPQPGEAELSIYNLLGQRVATLVHGAQEAGAQVLQWDGRDEQGRELASGVYFYRLQAGNWVETRKLLLCR